MYSLQSILCLVPACALVLGTSTPLIAAPRSSAPLTVSGIALDTQGRPLAGARVRLNADFIYGRVETTTGANGRYRIGDLLRATYRTEAFIERPYAGGTVCQKLAMPTPTDYNSFAVSQGAVRNFRWQLTGRVGFSNEYFGASIMMWLDGIERERARAVEFTLTPSGSLFDGTRAQVLVKEAVLRYPASEDGLKDLPLGTYSLRAVLLGKDGRRTPLGIATGGESTLQAEVPLVWRPSPYCGVGSSSGVEPFFVRLEPIK